MGANLSEEAGAQHAAPADSIAPSIRQRACTARSKMRDLHGEDGRKYWTTHGQWPLWVREEVLVVISFVVGTVPASSEMLVLNPKIGAYRDLHGAFFN